MEGLVETRRCQNQGESMANVVSMADDERCRRLIEEAMSSEAKKGESEGALSGEEHDFWMDTEAGMLGVYNFQGTVLGGDGSDEAGRMGAGFCSLHQSEITGCMRVGREQEGRNELQPAGTRSTRGCSATGRRNGRHPLSL